MILWMLVSPLALLAVLALCIHYKMRLRHSENEAEHYRRLYVRERGIVDSLMRDLKT